MKSRKAPGADCIAAEALKARGEEKIAMLMKICNAAGKVTKILVQKFDQPNTKKWCKLTPSSRVRSSADGTHEER